ncbi:MAG: hypothetical protein O6914_06040 [Chloroflexi bacterium]|nr:hypothetical protein [Chloroflexota bacterium]
MGLFGMFGSKKEDGVDIGGYGSDQVGMMKMLAGMPQMMRKPMMKGRLSQLLSLSEEKRQESIRDMVGAFHSPKIKDKAREKLIATRVEMIGEMPEEKRRTIMSSRAEALKTARDLEEADLRIQEQVLPHISEPARTAFDRTWNELMKNGNR